MSAIGRRDFLRFSAGATAALGLGQWSGGWRGAFEDPAAWSPLRQIGPSAPDALTLQAAVGTAEIGGGVVSPAWMLNQSLPSPLLRMRQGDRFRVTLDNQLQEEMILHWHGLTPPEASDGHPRFAVAPGGRYDYDFEVENRAGTYWYHSHTHYRTAKHTTLGIGGMILVEDDEERALGLPSGAYEIPIILQDRKLDEAGRISYTDPALTGGQTGSEPFGNGIRRPYLDVDRGVYRLRILNGSNARVFRVERSDGGPFVLIGNDGGLLERPVTLTWFDAAPAERFDVLVDLTGASPGEVITLRSREFQAPGMFDTIPGVTAQGTAMDLLQLRVGDRKGESFRVPERLSTIVDRPDPAAAVRERTVHFGSKSDPMSRGDYFQHKIDHKKFDMSRVDYHVPFGQTEIWTFTTDMMFSHPIHLHATHFNVLSREGGRGELFPWEAGLKDTVLLWPGETVKIAVRFTAHRGLFLVHCHNLEHEDVGMMANVMVE
jgi:FtsP/CotA-like multicopper oxidase with cupredoxin domain